MRKLYHDAGCKFITIKRTDKVECRHCKKESNCTKCLGHGWLWGLNGYGFTPYTLQSVYY